MEKKGINRLFLIIILIHCLASFLLSYLAAGFELGIVPNILISGLITLIPGLVYLFIYKLKKRNYNLQNEETLPQRLQFRKIKISTIFMIILFTYMVMPLTTVINAISMLFVDNTVLQISTDVLNMPFILMFFLIAMYAPFCEELIYRGIIFGGYKRETNLRKAVLLSALLFGLMHMNFNQAGYAFVIGIALALIVEATGSLWASMLCHLVFNAQSVCIMFLVSRFMPDFYKEASSMNNLTTDQLYLTIGVYLVIATFTTAIAVCILVWIAKNEGRLESLKCFFPSIEKSKGNIITISLILGMLIAIAYMILEVII